MVNNLHVANLQAEHVHGTDGAMECKIWKDILSFRP